jgi:hypothetical protein
MGSSTVLPMWIDKGYAPWWYPWWALGLFLLWVAGCTVLLWIGARHAAGLKPVRSVRYLLTVALSGGIPLLLAAVSPVVALLVILPLGWVLAKLMLRTRFTRAGLAWLPTLPAWAIAIPVMVLFVFPAVNESRARANADAERLVQCANNLYSVGKALDVYVNVDHNGSFPPNLEALLKEGNDPNWLRCPCSPIDGISYFYLAPLPENGPWTFIACDYSCNHPGRRSVLLKAGFVKLMREKEFSRELANPANARFAAALAAAEGSLSRVLPAASKPAGN